MVRNDSLMQCEKEVKEALQEFFNLCINNMLHDGELLVCYQNGFVDWDSNPCVGPGIDGIHNFPKINSIIFKGIGEITSDNDYFMKEGNMFFNGISTFEKNIDEQKKTYIDIWENTYFLTIFTQLIHLLNNEHYDWYLETSKLPPNGKSKHIREEIIKKLIKSPKLYNLIRIAYKAQIRNAIAHSQYTLVQGGIMYKNYKSDKYSNIEGLLFEDWEKIYIYTYLIFTGIFQILKQINRDRYIPYSKCSPNKGIQILIPNKEKKWIESYIYPDKKEETWRFVKTSNN